MYVLVHDLSTALRRLRRAPAFTLAAIGIVAIGIGANVAAFTVVNAFLLRPLGYHEADRLVHIYQDSDDGVPSSSSFPAYRDMAELDQVFAGVAATSSAALTWERPDGPRSVLVEFATSSLFPVLGLHPSRGRWFDETEDHPGAGAYAVVSHFTWTHAMGADPDLVGRTIRLEGVPVTVIGIGPETYNGSGGAVVTDFWLSISSTPVGGAFRVANLDRRQDHWYDVMARLAPEVSPAQAQGAMDLLADRLAADYPELNRGRGITVFGTDQVRVHPEIDAQLMPAGAMAMVVVGLVLVLTCSNLANLLLVRSAARAPELAVRRAMGASSHRVISLFLCEALTIAVAGGALGVALAGGAIRLVPTLPIPIPASAALDLRMDPTVWLYTLGLVLVTGLIFGGLPALRFARSNGGGAPGLARTEGARATVLETGILRRAMVAVQVAVSMALLVGAALFARSLVKAAAVDPGVSSESIAYLQTSVSRRDLSPLEIAVAVDEIRARLAAIPGVREVALASRLPVQNVGGSSTTVIDGYQPPSGTEAVELIYAVTSPDYFRALDIALLAGRGFGPQDTAESPATVVVNETAALRFWGGVEAAIGKRVRPQSQPDAWREVVGVVADSKVRRLTEPPTPLFYRSTDQIPIASPYLLARSQGDAATLAHRLLEEVREIDPTLPVQAAGTLGSYLGESLAASRALAVVLAGFSIVAMLLASLGIHAVVAFSVARRTAELGVRMALGARRAGIVRLVLREVMTTVGVGLAIGLLLAAGLSKLVGGLLFGVGRLDPLAFSVAAMLLLIAAAAACYVPARRATRVDPVVALRVR